MLQKKNIEPQKLLQAIFEAGYSAVLDIGIEAEDISHRASLLKDFPYAFMSVGLYPSNCDDSDLSSKLGLIASSLVMKKVIGVGEIGLDYYRNYGTREQQRTLLERQLDLARESSLPVIIHNRDADADIIGMLKEANLERRGVIHCFSSDKKTAKQLLDIGFYISFAGNASYPSSSPIQEALRYVPDDRILLETDAPYLAPQEKRGKANHSGYIQYLYLLASQLRSVPCTLLISKIRKNFSTLFNVSLQE
ncbi:MAG: TatD family hydrolase [Spirochaetales bacterium]|nr:TatD family hydrolase [Spirochaetales bacterium]